MKNGGWILCGICLLVLTGCGSDRSRDGSDPGLIPDFKIAEIENTSTAKHRSFTVRVLLPSHYSEKSVRSTLATLSSTLNEPESEITMLFYGPGANLRGTYDIARVIWKDNQLSEIDYKLPMVKQQKP